MEGQGDAKSGDQGSGMRNASPPSSQPEPEVQQLQPGGPWIPPSILRRKGKRNLLHDTIIDLIVKKALSLLNKITPTSFDKLAPKFLTLPMRDDDERIVRVFTVLFEKVVNEPLYNPTYVKLFWVASQTEAPEIFRKVRKVVMDRCQKEFQERDAFQEEVKVVEQKLAEKAGSGSANQTILKELSLELEDLKYLGRQRSLCNIRLLGQLYKMQMLTPKIIVEVVHTLLVPPGDDGLDLEYLCLLLRLVGQRLDAHLQALQQVATVHGKGQKWTFVPEPNWMTNIFSILESLSQSGEHPLRIRFNLMDLVELRQNGWRPRGGIEGPGLDVIDGVVNTSITTGRKKKKKRGGGRKKSPEELLATKIKEAAGTLLALTQQRKQTKKVEGDKLKLIKKIQECAEKMEAMQEEEGANDSAHEDEIQEGKE